MANYESFARSNYFKVKDLELFKDFAAKAGLEVWEKDDLVSICPSSDDGGFDYDLYHDDLDDEPGAFEKEDYLLKVLWPHLAEGSVAVLTEVGHEKLRYLSGTVFMVNWKGDEKYVDLHVEAEKSFIELGGEISTNDY